MLLCRPVLNGEFSFKPFNLLTAAVISFVFFCFVFSGNAVDHVSCRLRAGEYLNNFKSAKTNC